MVFRDPDSTGGGSPIESRVSHPLLGSPDGEDRVPRPYAESPRIVKLGSLLHAGGFLHVYTRVSSEGSGSRQWVPAASAQVQRLGD